MIVRLEQAEEQKEIEVLIKYAKRDETVERLETLLRFASKSVCCRSEDNTLWINAADIYYIESVEKRSFVYGERMVYRTELRLYQLLEELGNTGFVQINKSCILNIHVLESIRPLINSRMEATLSNGERIYITRKFIPAIKKALLER